MKNTRIQKGTRASATDLNPILTILRVFTSEAYAPQWPKNVSALDLQTLRVETLVKSSCSDSSHDVNHLRNQGLMEAKAPWVWMIDSDVTFCPKVLEEIFGLIHSEQMDQHGLIGGLYQSSSSDPIFDRGYNRLCNLWSQAHQTPLAGNVLVSRKILDASFSLASAPFGSEEHHLKAQALKRGLKVSVFDFKLSHCPKKNLKSLLASCRTQSRLAERHKTPWRKYLFLLGKSAKQAPLETLFSILYLMMSRAFVLLSPVLKFSQAVERRRFFENGRWSQNPHP